MTVTPQTIAAMSAFADLVGEHFAKEPDERVMFRLVGHHHQKRNH